MSNICIIPARGGSKRIPRKNVHEFCGLPMLAWPIKNALESECFDRVIVSTDDREIATIARKHGASVPCLRPKNLSDDFSTTLDVMKYEARRFRRYDNICCLYASAPFIKPQDLQKGLKALKSSDSNYAFSVTAYHFPIQRAIKINDNGQIEMENPEHETTRSQDLEERYHDAGAFYWGKTSAWIKGAQIMGGNSIGVKLPSYRVQDIDTLDDLKRAQLMFQTLLEEEEKVA